VFRLGDAGLELIEIAPGIELERDLLERIGFEVAIAEPVAIMDGRLFRPEPMNLLPEFRARARLGERPRHAHRGSP
jgi:propionate CoA-transferase